MKEFQYSDNIGSNPIAQIRILLLTMLLASYETEAFIGMNWGRESAQRLLPSQVVDLLLQNGIRHARIYSSQEDILEAFVNTDIDLTMTLTNPSVFQQIDDARKWIRKREIYFNTCKISTVTIGGSVFSDASKNITLLRSRMGALMNLQTALNEMGYNRIKASFVNYSLMLKGNILRKPSLAEFRDEIKWELMKFIKFLRANDAPFLVEMFPILEAQRIHKNISFAFMNNESGNEVKDANGAVYTNGFMYMYDSYVWALKKLNASDIRIVVTQVGWPTDGHKGATAANAEEFYKRLLPLVAGNTGTPMRPGRPLDIYVHALTDETKMRYSDPFTRHWGIYRSNGQPKYKIDLTGRGRDIYPVVMKGIMRMPKRWCMFNENMKDAFFVKQQMDYACRKGDCSSLAPGGSCSRLNFEQNVSYAFNMYFQFQFQAEKACRFGGLGQVVAEDPSTPECLFPVEVVKGKQLNYMPPLII